MSSQVQELLAQCGTDFVNKERVQLLVDALESGEFSQGKRRLKQRDGRMCCLGVACVVAMRNGLEIEELDLKEESEGLYFGSATHRSDTYLTTLVQDWYGFPSDNPDLLSEDETHLVSATYTNDDLGWGFHKIADGFRRTYLRDTTETNEENKNDEG